MIPFILGFTVSSVIALAANNRRALDSTGAIAAIALGTVVFGFAGVLAFLVFISFFALGNLPRLFADVARAERSWRQVIANGGFAGLFAVLYGLLGDAWLLAMFIGSVAISAADTLSSEIGRFSKATPRAILTFAVMPKGLSGAITPLGLLAGLLGAMLYGAIAWAMVGHPYGLLVVAGGFAGTLIDSLLGLIQVKYRTQEGLSEVKSEGAEVARGVRWLDNDLVNFLANFLALGVLAVLLSTFV